MLLDEARAVLGPHFEATEAEVAALPPTVDRDDVWTALLLDAHERGGHELFDPAWTKDRDDAYRAVERAIGKLRRVLERRKLGGETEPLLAALRALREPREPHRKLLRHTRRSMGWAAPNGRPRTPWREQSLKLLREAGCTVEAAEGLLDVAGLTAPRR